MEFCDGNQWHYVTDVELYVREREMYEMRTCSADPKRGYRMYVDTQFARQRELLQPRMRAYLHYQFPYEQAGSPEVQAAFFCDTIGALRANEMVMLDTEGASGLRNPADFMRRWCALVEPRLGTLAWIYVPSALADSLTRAVTGPRIVKAPATPVTLARVPNRGGRMTSGSTPRPATSLGPPTGRVTATSPSGPSTSCSLAARVVRRLRGAGHSGWVTPARTCVTCSGSSMIDR